MPTHYDALVIGAGQAGPSLAARLAAAGMTVALIEREHLGGTCVNDGCMPTKTLVASARAAHMARRALDYGVKVGGAVSVDMKAVKARKDLIVNESVASLTRWLDGVAGLRVIRGHARFVASHAVEVNGETLEAAKVFINVGGRPVLPDWPGVADVPVLTNTSILELDVLPEHLIVVGGSYIGLEFAQMFRRFGSRVTVLEYADRIIAREDDEVSREVQTILEREGVRFLLGTRDAKVVPSGNGARLRVSVKAGGVAQVVEGSHLLAAVGRRPNSDQLDLCRAGIATDARGFIAVDEQLRTNIPGVWALGDVNGQGAFTHTSYNDYEIVAANLLDGEQRRTADRIPAYALFTDPPLGRVGMTEAQVRASGRPALVGVMPMSRVGRARERGETQGFMKVLVDAQTERILGAALLCIEGDEIVHSLLDVMAADASYQVVRRSVHIHPTVSELIPTLLGNLKPLSAAQTPS
jgi:pyruvate/2-oxoglutarate dehydrogenase complex dihydrolipoamide dehydrogenase (E3) component